MVKITAQSATAALLAAAGVQGCAIPKANPAAVDLVANFEGWRPSVYRDPVGLETVGYGHLCQRPGCAEVSFPIPLSEANGKALLSQDMSSAENCITMSTGQNVHLNANQYGALVSWAFNVGCGNVKSSDLLKGLNRGDDPNAIASSELPQWNKAGGKILQGLVRRRAAELALFKTATGDGALPAPGC